MNDMLIFWAMYILVLLIVGESSNGQLGLIRNPRKNRHSRRSWL